MSFLVSNNNKIKNEGLTSSDGFQYHIAGDIFEPEISIEAIYELVSNGKTLPHLIGEFMLVIDDTESVYIISDEIATIKWYYYYDNEEFILSNNFWEIACIKDIGVDDINKNCIYEQLLLNQSLSNQTILKNVNTVPSGSVLCFSKSQSRLSVTKYNDIKYEDTPNSLNKKEVFDNIDKQLKKTIEKIIEMNNDAKIGVTISGGLDSRFPLPYIKDLDNPKMSYLIGTHKGFFNAYDYNSAKTMANMYNINLKFVNPFSQNMKEKIKIDILRNPNKASNILKAIDMGKSFDKDEFNILLTGAYGGLIGGRVLNKELLNSKDMEDLSKNLFFDYSQLKQFNNIEKGLTKYSVYSKRLNRLFKLFFKSNSLNKNNLKDKTIDQFMNSNFLISKETKSEIYQNIRSYVNKEKQLNKNNISIIMKMHLYRHGLTGAFESLHGQVKAYSIYHPYIYEYSKKWPVSFLENRSIMEEFLLFKHKELADIPLQNYNMPIKYRFNKTNVLLKAIIKIKAFFNFKLRGLSIDYNSWWNHKSVQELVHETFEKKDSYFYTIFNKKDIDKALKYPRHSHLIEYLLKIKLIVDMIENKEYKQLVDYPLKESSKY